VAIPLGRRSVRNHMTNGLRAILVFRAETDRYLAAAVPWMGTPRQSLPETYQRGASDWATGNLSLKIALHTFFLTVLLRSCFKISQLAQYGVKKSALNAHLLPVNCALSPIFALSCTHLSNFKTVSKLHAFSSASHPSPTGS
jgi:hypothetical protein